MHWQWLANNSTDIALSREMLWTTIIFGALALVFSIISIITTFYIARRARYEHIHQTIIDNIESLLKNLKASFDDIGQSIFYKNKLGLKRAVDSFDIYMTLTLDELNPQIFATLHSRAEFSVYRKIMENMMKNSLPLALDRYNSLVSLNKEQLKSPKIKGDKITFQTLNESLKKYSERLEKKRGLIAVLKNNPKQKWIYTQKELAEFRTLLGSIWSNLFEAFKQYQKDLNENKSNTWEAMDNLYNEQETKFHQFRGTLQSLFLN